MTGWIISSAFTRPPPLVLPRVERPSTVEEKSYKMTIMVCSLLASYLRGSWPASTVDLCSSLSLPPTHLYYHLPLPALSGTCSGALE